MYVSGASGNAAAAVFVAAFFTVASASSCASSSSTSSSSALEILLASSSEISFLLKLYGQCCPCLRHVANLIESTAVDDKLSGKQSPLRSRPSAARHSRSPPSPCGSPAAPSCPAAARKRRLSGSARTRRSTPALGAALAEHLSWPAATPDTSFSVVLVAHVACLPWLGVPWLPQSHAALGL